MRALGAVVAAAGGLLLWEIRTNWERCPHRCACPLDLYAGDHRRSCTKNLYHAPWHPRGEQ